MMIEFDNIGGPMKVTIIKQDGCNIGRIRKEFGYGWSVRIREGMPWKSTWDHGKAGFMTNTKVFKKEREAVDFAKDFFNNDQA